ncbi:CDP-glucose 4,6-dehydratase [Polynucleobacter alcilacus]|uniref:CDP-glucose 4,6-dehydratase n=1 Tax=Polynucleobacter alcilacus TaxID=1819739 RepID=UPI001C0AE034|nr:CDP-glucose 4,6-dehydratase [Polynucleobacter alcilacus]MBU3568203.1 CDP-glucose 4,6-dehydratase [Polynucleobacter alcilacus]
MSLSSRGEVNPQFWSGKSVFLTGHTGFKGGWISVWLSSMGAKITGFSLAPNTDPNLFEVAGIASLCVKSHIGDIRHLDDLRNAMLTAGPDIVIHMAAQPLVRYSYSNPVQTYETNVMGTVHVLEAIRSCKSVKSVVIVTTDKCYENKEWVWGYRENEPMGGYDPYSNSKGCAELVTSSYRQSFFPEKDYVKHGVAIASVRAGNVIGGGDWSLDRLVPDAITAFESGKPLMIRNPLATRPWQHVLEPLSGYLVLAQALYEQGAIYGNAWNFGPIDADTRSVKEVIELLIDQWDGAAAWKQDGCPAPHEAQSLKLDCSKAREELAWTARWRLEKAIKAIVQWQAVYRGEGDVRSMMQLQINDYCHSGRSI